MQDPQKEENGRSSTVHDVLGAPWQEEIGEELAVEIPPSKFAGEQKLAHHGHCLSMQCAQSGSWEGGCGQNPERGLD
jgi:hypothetical protein